MVVVEISKYHLLTYCFEIIVVMRLMARSYYLIHVSISQNFKYFVIMVKMYNMKILTILTHSVTLVTFTLLCNYHKVLKIF